MKQSYASTVTLRFFFFCLFAIFSKGIKQFNLAGSRGLCITGNDFDSVFARLRFSFDIRTVFCFKLVITLDLIEQISWFSKLVIKYTLFQNGHYFSGLLFALKLALVASFLNSKFKRIFSLERGNKG